MSEAAEQNSTGAIGDPLWDDWDTPPLVPETPELHLSGFDGPLDLLLDLAEDARIDLSQLSVTDMVDQFVAAMARYVNYVPLERRADWVSLAARLLVLRSRLLLPASSAAEQDALDAVERGRLQNLQWIRAATAWLDARPQLGRDTFPRPQRNLNPRVASYMRLMEACLAVLETEEAREQPELEEIYTPVIRALFRIPDALARIRGRMASVDAPMKLTGFLPRMPEEIVDRELIARSAVASTFFASLELARAAELTVGTGERFEELTCIVPQGSRPGPSSFSAP